MGRRYDRLTVTGKTMAENIAELNPGHAGVRCSFGDRDGALTAAKRPGGVAPLTTVVEDFYARVLADARLVGYFRNSDMTRLKRNQVAFFVAALGGPEPYQGLSMADAHRDRNIGRLQFDLVVGHLTAALRTCGVPEATTAAIIAAIAPLSDDIVTDERSAALG